jgi:Na+/H+ antiporter NhaD/arsenite permease-like protein
MKYEYPALTVIGSASGVLLGAIGSQHKDSVPADTFYDGLGSLEAEW